MALARVRRSARSLTDMLYVLALPVVLAGTLLLDAASGDPKGDDKGDDKGEPPDSKDDDKPDPKLGAAGERALREERAARTKAERDAKAVKKELDDLKAASATDAEKAIAKAKQEGKTEALKLANARVMKSEIKAAAAGRLANPAVAVRLLDPDDFTDDDGEVDEKKLKAAIDQLLKDEPYLAGKGRANGDGGGGPRGTDAAPSMDDWLRGQARAGRR
jgi:hypothetical protein